MAWLADSLLLCRTVARTSTRQVERTTFYLAQGLGAFCCAGVVAIYALERWKSQGHCPRKPLVCTGRDVSDDGLSFGLDDHQVVLVYASWAAVVLAVILPLCVRRFLRSRE